VNLYDDGRRTSYEPDHEADTVSSVGGYCDRDSIADSVVTDGLDDRVKFNEERVKTLNTQDGKYTISITPQKSSRPVTDGVITLSATHRREVSLKAAISNKENVDVAKLRREIVMAVNKEIQSPERRRDSPYNTMKGERDVYKHNTSLMSSTSTSPANNKSAPVPINPVDLNEQYKAEIMKANKARYICMHDFIYPWVYSC
jgi:hypothetical protein